MLCKKKRVIVVASNALLLNKHYYLRLWIAVRALKVSRRKLLDTIASAFLADDIYVIYPSGEPYPIPEIDEAFGDDPDMRWFSVFLLADMTGENPKHFSRKMERLRLIDLYVRVAHPTLAVHLGK